MYVYYIYYGDESWCHYPLPFSLQARVCSECACVSVCPRWRICMREAGVIWAIDFLRDWFFQPSIIRFFISADSALSCHIAVASSGRLSHISHQKRCLHHISLALSDGLLIIGERASQSCHHLPLHGYRTHTHTSNAFRKRDRIAFYGNGPLRFFTFSFSLSNTRRINSSIPS